MDDRSTMLATMYQTDAEATSSSVPLNPQMRTRKIRVGAVEYEVPSVDYMNRLEQAIQRQAQELQQQRKLLDRVTALVTNARSSQHGYGRAMAELRQEMNKKITLRDFS